MGLKELAVLVDDAAMQASAIEQLTVKNDFSIDEAYEIQKLSIDKRLERGEELIGLKMGFTSEAKMVQMGVHDMIWGRLTSTMNVADGGSISMSKFIHPRAEPEVCFRLSKDIDRELTIDECKEHVDGVAAAIEVIDSRYENFKFSLADVIADNCSSSALVIGEWKPMETELSDLRMTLEVDGVVEAEGSSNDILNDPWRSMQAATRLAAQYGQKMKAGMVLMAGAATNAVFLKTGQTISTTVESLGSVSFDVKE